MYNDELLACIIILKQLASNRDNSSIGGIWSLQDGHLFKQIVSYRNRFKAFMHLVRFDNYVAEEINAYTHVYRYICGDFWGVGSLPHPLNYTIGLLTSLAIAAVNEHNFTVRGPKLS